jgi:alkylresorcinol/alkylpyrone synthase
MSTDVKILGTGTATPPFTETLEETLQHVERWIANEPERTREKIVRIFRNARVGQRYSIMSGAEVFTPMPFHERNQRYAAGMKDLGEKALLAALTNSGIAPQELDFLITTSCTGIMIPSVDAFLVNRLGLRQDIIRLPVTEMGCAGGTSGLTYAFEFLKNNPGKKAAVLALESPTATFQVNDFSMANVVSAAIFGDGAACAILGQTEEVRPTLQRTKFYHFFNEERMMGFDLVEGGLQMVLDVSVPDKIASHFPGIVGPFLQACGLQPEQIKHYIFHPGGKRILQTIEDLMGAYAPDLSVTYDILARHGNMSSATVLYVLDAFLKKEIPAGEHGLMMSFGPGFTAQMIHMQWK